jgi:SAM-dependent methyltransferase
MHLWSFQDKKSSTYANQGDLFGKLASSDILYHYPQESLDKLNALVPDKGCLLELGCGDGIIGQALDGSPVIGLDISPYCVKLSNSRGLHSTVGDAIQALPFKDDAFDTVSCIDVLHHLDQQWDSIFAELHRVLKPGGTLCIVEPDARNPLVRWTQAPGSPIRVAPWHNEPAIHPDELIPQLEARRYAFDCSPIHIEGQQSERSTFPLW